MSFFLKKRDIKTIYCYYLIDCVNISHFNWYWVVHRIQSRVLIFFHSFFSKEMCSWIYFNFCLPSWFKKWTKKFDFQLDSMNYSCVFFSERVILLWVRISRDRMRSRVPIFLLILSKEIWISGLVISSDWIPWTTHATVAIYELLWLKNVGAQISMFFTSNK